MAKESQDRSGETRGQVIDMDRFRTRRREPAEALLPMVDFGAGWYHDAAIAEAGRSTSTTPNLRTIP